MVQLSDLRILSRLLSRVPLQVSQRRNPSFLGRKESKGTRGPRGELHPRVALSVAYSIIPRSRCDNLSPGILACSRSRRKKVYILPRADRNFTTDVKVEETPVAVAWTFTACFPSGATDSPCDGEWKTLLLFLGTHSVVRTGELNFRELTMCSCLVDFKWFGWIVKYLKIIWR